MLPRLQGTVMGQDLGDAGCSTYRGVVKFAEYALNNESWRLLVCSPFVFKRRLRHLGALAFLLGRILFRGSIHKPIVTGKTLILLLYTSAFFYCLSWSRNLL